LPGPAGEWPERTASAAGAVLETRPVSGRHEVIVECPHFESNLARLPVQAVRDVLFVYRQRLRAHREEGWAYASVFKNKGREAGATVAHSHSQVLALPTVPEAIGREIARARTYFAEHGESAAAAAMRAERDDGRRMLAEAEGCLAFCPFASRFGYECRLAPVAPAACFDRTPDERLDALASLLRRTLLALETVLGEFAYNLVLRTLPFTEPPDVPWYRWSLDLLPRLGRLAGFELGGGPLINPVAPERAAGEIRAAW
jgi:UDPglucose--hexose-1-phosphate uridylyltransferase